MKSSLSFVLENNLMVHSSLEEMLIQEAYQVGIILTKPQVAQFLSYIELLQTWNQKMNLTAVRDPSQMISYHFLDSLVLVKHLPKTSIASLLDVGSGAGFPGAVCALMYPNLQITLVERIQKKAAFLLSLRRELKLNFQVVLEDLKMVQGTFDMVTSRATFPPKVWLRTGAPFVRQHGFLFAMLGPSETNLEEPKGFTKTIDFSYKIGHSQRHLQGFQKQSSVDFLR